MTTELLWESPGPGTWHLVADHYPRPVTAVLASLMETWSEASTEYMTLLGFPIDRAVMTTVNGLPYYSMIAGGGSGPKKPPPAWVMRLAVRLVPSLRRAQRRLTEVLATRPWNQGIDAWYSQDRARARARLFELATIDPDALDDHGLAAHLDRIEAEARRSMREHLLLHAHDLLPPGLVAVEARRFGFSIPEALELLRGGSPASTGASPELRQLRSLIDGRPFASLDELRALGADVSGALDEFLARYGWSTISGYDVDGVCLAESPSLVLHLAGGVDRTDPAADRQRVEAALARVPAAERAQFDRVLREGRAAYGLRDDNSSILIAWPLGILRRAMLAAGRRLVDGGGLTDGNLAIEASIAELTGALRGTAGIDQPGLERRAAARRALRAADAPRELGPPEPAMPAGMPGALGTVFDIFSIYDFGVDSAGAELSGIGIGREPVEGTARVVLGTDDGADRVEPGDIVVAPMTSPSYNMLLAIAGGVVTEEGTIMSHAAIMARELGIAAVLNVGDATRLIGDGDRIRVDPIAGRVEILERAVTAHATSNPTPVAG